MDKKTLLTESVNAAGNAYSPYSGFSVGAAVFGTNGEIYTGANIENSSYGLTVCAERVAIFNMVNAGCKGIAALAVYCGGGASCMPCGACRQVISEFAKGDIPIFTKGSVHQKDFLLSELLPHAFGGDFDEKI